jgi:hypothetical protein
MSSIRNDISLTGLVKVVLAYRSYAGSGPQRPRTARRGGGGAGRRGTSRCGLWCSLSRQNPHRGPRESAPRGTRSKLTAHAVNIDLVPAGTPGPCLLDAERTTPYDAPPRRRGTPQGAEFRALEADRPLRCRGGRGARTARLQGGEPGAGARAGAGCVRYPGRTRVAVSARARRRNAFEVDRHMRGQHRSRPRRHARALPPRCRTAHAPRRHHDGAERDRRGPGAHPPRRHA